jgi:hypothetical protein
MYEEGVAEELEEAFQQNAGLPSKYKLTRPEYILLVDETGCNTNQLNKGKVGGERRSSYPKMILTVGLQQVPPLIYTTPCFLLSQDVAKLFSVQSSLKVKWT